LLNAQLQPAIEPEPLSAEASQPPVEETEVS
jgi:hypothetical protein